MEPMDEFEEDEIQEFLDKMKKGMSEFLVNPLPNMSILGTSNSEANKDMISKIWTNGDTFI